MYKVLYDLKCLIVVKKYRKIGRNYSEVLESWELEESRSKIVDFLWCDMIGIHYR